jgi:nitrite reductase (NADH) small subunit
MQQRQVDGAPDQLRVPLDEVTPGKVHIVPYRKFGIGVFNIDGDYFALTNYCPHRGAPLCRGEITGLVVAGEQPYEVHMARHGEIIRCPWHAWEFDIKTGRSITAPVRRMRTYRTSVEDGQLVIELRGTVAELEGDA